MILSACHKLIEIFREHPEQSEHLITHRGVISIMELLDVENAQVVHAVLQLVNQVRTIFFDLDVFVFDFLLMCRLCKAMPSFKKTSA